MGREGNGRDIGLDIDRRLEVFTTALTFLLLLLLVPSLDLCGLAFCPGLWLMWISSMYCGAGFLCFLYSCLFFFFFFLNDIVINYECEGDGQ